MTPERDDTEKSVRDDTEAGTISLHAEEISLSKRKVTTGGVRVSVVTRQHEELVDELLAHEHAEIARTAIGKQIDAMPTVREEGDTMIIPIVEEVLVVERRLVLKEEIRLRRVRGTERHQERVTLRKQEAVITRLPGEIPAPGASSAAEGQGNRISGQGTEIE